MRVLGAKATSVEKSKAAVTCFILGRTDIVSGILRFVSIQEGLRPERTNPPPDSTVVIPRFRMITAKEIRNMGVQARARERCHDNPLMAVHLFANRERERVF